MKRLLLLILLAAPSSFADDVELLCKDILWSNYVANQLHVDIGNALITLTELDEKNQSYVKVLGHESITGDYLMLEVDKLSIYARNLSSKNKWVLNLDRYDGSIQIQKNDKDEDLVWVAEGQCNLANPRF